MFFETFMLASRRLFTGNSPHHESASPYISPEIPQDISSQVAPIEVSTKPSFRADSRLSRARENKPGLYRLHRKNGAKIIFKVWSVRHHETGCQLVRIFPISSYDENGKLVAKVESSPESTNAFFPRSILYGVLDINRVPPECRKALESWTPLFIEGIALYDQSREQCNSRSRNQ